MLQKKSFGKKKLNFMQVFKSAILPELKNCQFGNFEPVHEIQTFLPNDFFWSIMKMTFQEISLTYPKVQQIQDLGQLK